MIVFTPNTVIKSADINLNFANTANIAYWNNPYKFYVYRSGALASGVVVYENERFDTNNNYDTSTGRYTAPITGFYQFNVTSIQSVTSAPQDPQTGLYKSTGECIALSHFVNMYNGASSGSANVSALAYLTVGQYVYVSVARTLDVSNAGFNNFSGFLVSAI